jgi:hypothetical protein
MQTQTRMTRARAIEIAHEAHNGQRDHDGTPHIQHVMRVVNMVPPSAQIVAALHDVIEDTDVDPRPQLAPVERDALALLTREPDQTYAQYIQRLADAPGYPGALARRVKEADMVDNLRRSLESGHGLQDRYRRHLPQIQMAVARDVAPDGR